MSDSQIIPEWEELGIPVDDGAEPDDANVAHEAPEDNEDADDE